VTRAVRSITPTQPVTAPARGTGLPVSMATAKAADRLPILAFAVDGDVGAEPSFRAAGLTEKTRA